MATKKLLEQVTARVFCHGAGGGNPVSVFFSPSPLPMATKVKLAKSCEWESVMVTPNENNQNMEMSFYMPSGSEVSFCAHAALGGAFATIAGDGPKTQFVFQRSMKDDVGESGVSETVSISEQEQDGRMGIARLKMTAKFVEAPVSHRPTLYRLLRGHLGLASEHLVSQGRQYPSLVNASIARPKTLVHVNSLRALQQAKQPKVSIDPSQRNSFASACAAIDQSTGIYLYANRSDEVGAWECRQFPQASGYPEDPATGIAAAALAGSLYKQGIYLPVYKFYQGFSMNRPSLIEVLDLTMDGESTSFTLQGRVEIDSRQTMDVEIDQ